MRLRLILSFILIVLVSVTSVVLIARQNTASEVRAFMFHGGMTDLQNLAVSLADYYRAYGSWQDVQSLLNNSSAGRGRGSGGGGMMHGAGTGMMSQRLRLADAEGNLVADTYDSQPLGQLNSADMATALHLEVDGQTVGYLLAEGGMGFNSGDETFLLSRLTRAALTAGLIAGTISLLLALALTYNLLQPVRALTRAAVYLGQGDLSQRVQVKGDDELAALGRTFNYMADSLQKAEESRREMTADVAHELRTPLAVQRASLEAIQDGIYPLTPENLEPILEQNRLLTRLVEDLRTLALAEAGQLKLELTPTDLTALVDRLVERYKPQATSRQVELSVKQPALPLPLISVDPMRVEQIISNLLSNALRYTPEEGKITLIIDQAADVVQLSVHNNGTGIPGEELPHIFERFYRVDRARSRQEGGSGLGLAIARQLAEANGGTLTAANHPQGGAVFTLALPIG
jgi:two-component system sensor histidine kinase BaeS